MLTSNYTFLMEIICLAGQCAADSRQGRDKTSPAPGGSKSRNAVSKAGLRGRAETAPLPAGCGAELPGEKGTAEIEDLREPAPDRKTSHPSPQDAER